MGTVDTDRLTDEEAVNPGDSLNFQSGVEKEVLEAAGVDEAILRVHGNAPGTKLEGVCRLIYENLNGLNSRPSNNGKLEKASQLNHDLEVDVACYNEHRLNLMHKDNRNGFLQLFRGGEADIRTVAAHNKHEGRELDSVQEGGTAMVLFGNLIEQFDMEESGRDESGLGRWVVMTFRGEGGRTTRIVCSYNPCYNKKQVSRTSYQQHMQYFLTKENDDTCPQTRFRADLIQQLKAWRETGDRLIVCMDANEHIYRKSIKKLLMESHGLGMKEVVGEFTAQLIGATYFRGSNPIAIDAVWATPDVEVVGTCVMPAGFGVGDHRTFVVDFSVSSIEGIGMAPSRIVQAPSCRLNTKIPRIADQYNKILEKRFVGHWMNSRLLEASNISRTVAEVKRRLEAIDEEGLQYKRHAEKKCRKIKSGRIPFSPEASVWIRHRQVYQSLIWYKRGEIRNKSNLRWTAQRCGIKQPLQLSRR